MLVVRPRARARRGWAEGAAHLRGLLLFLDDGDRESLVREPLHPAIRPRAETAVPDVEHVVGLRAEVAEDAEPVAEARERQVDGCAEDASCVVARSREAGVGEAHAARHSADGERASDDLERALAARAVIEQLLTRDFDEVPVPARESSRRNVACMCCHGFHVPLDLSCRVHRISQTPNFPPLDRTTHDKNT